MSLSLLWDLVSRAVSLGPLSVHCSPLIRSEATSPEPAPPEDTLWAHTSQRGSWREDGHTCKTCTGSLSGAGQFWAVG